MTAFRTIRTADRELMTVQQNVTDALKDIDDSLIVEGVLIGPVVIGTGNTVIPHSLKRMPLIWFPVRKKGLGDIYEVSINANNLTLISSVSVTTYLWCA